MLLIQRIAKGAFQDVREMYAQCHCLMLVYLAQLQHKASCTRESIAWIPAILAVRSALNKVMTFG
jgi:hypothetical protein